MKKSKMIVLLPVLLIFSSTLISCGNSEQPLEKQTFSIVFKQNGVEDIIKTVKEGENLVDIPNPTEKTGYSVIWDMTNFNNITSNLIINAIEILASIAGNTSVTSKKLDALSYLQNLSSGNIGNVTNIITPSGTTTTKTITPKNSRVESRGDFVAKQIALGGY